ncbi:MAG: PhzF family phenazine biosynthesis protein [Verrucomicrobiota bacterium]
MKIPLYQIDAFTDRPFKGNPAAVCPLEEWLPEEMLQAIAEENNLAETAFYVLEEAGYRIRWFTPVKEVDLCGHATLAAARVLLDHGCSDKSAVEFQSNSGPLRVLREQERLTLDFPSVPASPCEVPVALEDGLGVSPEACLSAADYLVVLSSAEAVAGLDPDFRRLKDLDLRGVIVTGPGESEDFVSRFFAPNFGIDEDPVTGSAHCTLAPYWADRLGKKDLSAKQISKRTGNLWCRVAGDRVFISGHTAAYLQGMIQI